MKKAKTKIAKVVTLSHNAEKKRGTLVFSELGDIVPFSARRIFYFHNVPSAAIRGLHAHKKASLFFLCLRGSVALELDNGTSKQRLVLRGPTQGTFIKPMIWHSLNRFSKGAVVLVLASHAFSETDYIRDYAQFLKSI